MKIIVNVASLENNTTYNIVGDSRLKMILSEEQINAIIEEETRNCIKESALGSIKDKLGYGKFKGLAIVWNNEGAKPISSALSSVFPKSLLDAIPQGHAGLIVVDSSKKATAVDFGAGDTWGCKNDQLGWGRRSRAAYGVLTHGGFRVLRNGTASVNKDGSISRKEVARLLAISPMAAANKATEWGVILNFDASTVLSKVGANKNTCSPYSILPAVPALPSFLKDPKKEWFEGDGDNCGTMAMRLVKLGSGFIKSVPASLAQKLVFAPDQVVGLLRTLQVFSISS